MFYHYVLVMFYDVPMCFGDVFTCSFLLWECEVLSHCGLGLCSVNHYSFQLLVDVALCYDPMI